MDIKTPMHMRLTGTARKIMVALAQKKGVSQTAIVELAVRLMADQEGLQISEEDSANGNEG